METAVTKSNGGGIQLSSEVLSSVVLNGDVSKLQAGQKVEYYQWLCERVGIDPATQPFKLLKLNGKEIFYADKGATQQLSQKHGISHEIVKREQVGDVYVVTVRAKTADNRYTDEDGAVKIGGLSGDNLANALMKATTKAKRRAVLAIMGLGMLDESEIETIRGAEPVEMPNVPSVQEAIVTEEKKAERSKEYYDYRDSLLALEDEPNALIEELKSYKKEIEGKRVEGAISQNEYADLEKIMKRIYNKRFKPQTQEA